MVIWRQQIDSYLHVIAGSVCDTRVIQQKWKYNVQGKTITMAPVLFD